MRKIRNTIRTKFWLENLRARDLSEGLGVDGTITLKWIFGKQGLRM
jgi:hypothetical protein